MGPDCGNNFHNKLASEEQNKMIGVSNEQIKRVEFKSNSHKDAQWFSDAGLGLFIHYGISSVNGNIDLSWGMMADTTWDKEYHGTNKVTPSQYFQLAEKFNPDKYNPEKWLKAAKESGFTYAVFTAKHHDGYALWPSKYGDFGTSQFLNGRDFVGEYIQACRNVGLKVGLYYSPPDWYYNRFRMSFRFNSDGTKGNPNFGINHEVIEISGYNGWDDSDKGLAISEYDKVLFKEYIKGQIEELLTQYGKIDVIWFDGGPDAISIERIRELQPGIVINPRMHGYGDFNTPECKIPEEPIKGWWELCEPWHETWGYIKNPEKCKSTGWMLSRFCQVRAMGGNYLINFGPGPDGDMPYWYYDRMDELSIWISRCRESVFGVSLNAHPHKSNVPVTVKGNIWYLHLLPEFKGIVEINDVEKPIRITILNLGEELKSHYEKSKVFIDVPIGYRTNLVDVIKIEW